ncbi:MAG: aspartyl protease family protein [Chlamydiota bacterium]
MRDIFLSLLLSTFLLHGVEQEPVEIAIEVSHGIPFVSLQINDAHYLLILDSGAEKSRLSEEILACHSLVETGNTITLVNVYGTLSASQIYVADQISVGNFALEKCEFAADFTDKNRLDSNSLPELRRGLIGRECFRDKALAVDRRRRKCLVAAHSDQLISHYQNEVEEWIKLSFTLEDGVTLKLKDQGVVKRFLVDTGCNYSLIHDDAVELQLLTTRLESIAFPIEIDSGEFLGEHSFLKANLSPIGFDGIIGFDFFDRFLVIFDFTTNELFLAQIAHKALEKFGASVSPNIPIYFLGKI